MLTRRAALMGAAFVAAAPLVIKTVAAEEVMDTSAAAPVDLSGMTRREVKLLTPPHVHAHEQVATVGPQIVEKEIQVDEYAWLQAMAFNGSVPGPMMVVHEGDYVELTTSPKT
jgi:nitrite reductase (NO-forming)